MTLDKIQLESFLGPRSSGKNQISHKQVDNKNFLKCLSHIKESIQIAYTCWNWNLEETYKS